MKCGWVSSNHQETETHRNGSDTAPGETAVATFLLFFRVLFLSLWTYTNLFSFGSLSYAPFHFLRWLRRLPQATFWTIGAFDTVKPVEAKAQSEKENVKKVKPSTRLFICLFRKSGFSEFWAARLISRRLFLKSDICSRLGRRHVHKTKISPSECEFETADIHLTTGSEEHFHWVV